jgi:D-tyrosyl-tRNA(Tyr) deacylase
VAAAEPAKAAALYDYFIEAVRRLGISVETGRFGAMMEVALVNDGPVTLILENQG